MLLNNSVFGHTKFRIKDSLLFKKDFFQFVDGKKIDSTKKIISFIPFSNVNTKGSLYSKIFDWKTGYYNIYY